MRGVETKVWFHNHYLVYYNLDPKGMTYHFYVIDLDSNEKTKVGDISSQVIEDVKFEDDKMILQSVSYSTVDKSSTCSYYLYDLSAQKLTKLLNKVDGSGYTITQNTLYYDEAGVIMKYDIDSKRKTILYNGDDVLVKLSYDSQYLYVNKFSNDDKYVLVLDYDGNLIDKIPFNITDTTEFCMFGGEDYLFYDSFNKQTQAYDWYYYDKSLIGTGKGEWVLIEPVT